MSASLADLFRRITQGVYVIGVGRGELRNAFTAASVMQVSFDPPLIALSVNPLHTSYALLRQTSTFSINVLARDRMDLAAHFGQPASAKTLDAADWTEGRAGSPLLTAAIAWFECQMISEHPAGDHVLVLGRVTDGRIVEPAAIPLTYRETDDLDGAAALYPDTFD